MMADADLSRPADGRIQKGFTWEDIDLPSFEQYRRLFATVRPDHPWIIDGVIAFILTVLGKRTCSNSIAGYYQDCKKFCLRPFIWKMDSAKIIL